MKVYLDDTRAKPPGFDVLVRSSKEAIELLKTGKVTLISLDHDLGPHDNGYIVATWIEQRAAEGLLNRIECHIHSANPVGVKRMRQALEWAICFWDQKEKKK